MGLNCHFQSVMTFANLIPFIQVHVSKLGTIIRSFCWEGFMRTILFESNHHLKLYVILCMLHVLIMFMNYQTLHQFPNK